jgi:hypothetical protein
MAGPIKSALVEMGYRVREYSPVGELLPGMSYLVRRLLENTSNEGFLRAKFSDNQSAAQLLRDPDELITREKPTKMQPKQEQSADGAAYKTPQPSTSSIFRHRSRCAPPCARRAASLAKGFH